MFIISQYIQRQESKKTKKTNIELLPWDPSNHSFVQTNLGWNSTLSPPQNKTVLEPFLLENTVNINVLRRCLHQVATPSEKKNMKNNRHPHNLKILKPNPMDAQKEMHLHLKSEVLYYSPGTHLSFVLGLFHPQKQGPL